MTDCRQRASIAAESAGRLEAVRLLHCRVRLVVAGQVGQQQAERGAVLRLYLCQRVLVIGAR
jgi:hypothetical protein